MNKNNINNITLNDLNFYYSFIKEKVDSEKDKEIIASVIK